MFILYSTDDDRQLPTEYLPCSAIQPKYGMAMYVTSGKLAVASGANLATHICVRQESAAVAAGTLIPVVRIQKDQVWETTGASGTTAGVGCDVKSGGLEIEVQGTNPNNNFVVDRVIDSTAHTVLGRFVK